MIHDDYEPLKVKAQYDEQKGKFKFFVNYWPEKLALSKTALKTKDLQIEVDENIIDFIVDNGRARYYIVKGIEQEWHLYAKKFYHITY